MLRDFPPALPCTTELYSLLVSISYSKPEVKTEEDEK